MRAAIAILLLFGIAQADPLPARKATSRPSTFCAANPTKCVTSGDVNGILDALSGAGDAITPKVSGATVTATGGSTPRTLADHLATLPDAAITATGSTTARSLAARFADVSNVKDHGADPTAASAMQDMLDRMTPGKPGVIGDGARISIAPSYTAPGVVKFEDLSWPDDVTVRYDGPTREQVEHINNLAPDQTVTLPGGTYLGAVPVNEHRISAPYHLGFVLDIKTPASYGGVKQTAHLAADAMEALGMDPTQTDRSILFAKDGTDQWQLVAHGDASLELHQLQPSSGSARYARLHFAPNTGDLGIQRSFAIYPLDVGGAMRVVAKPSTDATDGNRYDNFARYTIPKIVLEQSDGTQTVLDANGGYFEVSAYGDGGGVTLAGYKGATMHAVNLDAFYPRLAPGANNTIKLGDAANSRRWSTVDTVDVNASGSVTLSGIAEYADNATAVAAGLGVGRLYRTGDVLKVVH